MSTRSIIYLICSLLFIGLNLSAQTTYYVDCSASAGGSGNSWPTAFNDLQSALGIAGNGDIIVVAQGAYSPSSSDPDISFQLVNGVAMLGGFLNTDINLTQRDPVNNPTILTGSMGADCNGNGGSGNSYSVLFSNNVSAATLVDGFIITAGNAGALCSGPLRQRHGGGWFNSGTGLNNNSSPTIKNCTFLGNSANCGGGAIFNDGSSGGNASPNFENCTFEGNYGGAAGGAVYNNGNDGISSPVFTKCKFIANGTDLSAVTYGGAFYNLGKNGNSSPIFLSCLFQENSGYAGGGMYNLGETGNANPQIRNCTFYGNSAVHNGGAVYANAGNAPDIGNADPYITNSIFFANTASPSLGPIFRNNYGEFTVINCLFDVAANCLDLNSGVGPDVNCLGTNLFSEDPQFVNAGNDDFSLGINSPAVGAGENSEVGGTQDLLCNNRIQQSNVDMGAIESPYLPAPSPIELINFQASLNEGKVDIEWTTLSETRSDIFEIERSIDGVNFEVIHHRPAGGNTHQVIVYETVDAHPHSGFNYYRLVETSLDGRQTFSDIRVVEFSEFVVEVFPNPAIADLNLSVSKMGKGQVQFEICNLMGAIEIAGNLEVGQHKSTLNIPEISELDAGIYMIRVFDGGRKQQLVRFTKIDL